MMVKRFSFLVLYFLMITSTAFANNALLQDLDGMIDIVVDAGGTGDYTTVQAAINAVPDNSASRVVVFIKNGSYYEKVRISSSKKNLVLIGENIDSTIIYFDDYAALTGFDCTTVKVDANDFLAMNLTIENSFDNVVARSQALALATYGDRQVFLHCKFLGFQDTYFSGSNYRAYFKDCLFVGAVDYIYGPTTILLDSCQIHNIRREGGYITAASTPEGNKFGYVFRNCWVSGDNGVSNVDFGRPWRPYASVVWLNCYESSCVSAKGWNNWGNVDNEATAFYAEYNCYGPGSDTSNRVNWCRQLTAIQAAEYTMENIFAASSNTAVSADWLPVVDDDELYSIIKKHTIKFLDPSNVSAKLSILQSNGEDIEGFHPDSSVIVVELPSGTTEIPVLLAESENDKTSIEISYPSAIPGFATIKVMTPYMANYAEYKVYFSIDDSYHSANILSIAMNGVDIEDFDPDITFYSLRVPDGTSRYMSLSVIAEVDGARVKKIRPSELPGQYEFQVTAVDGYSTKVYFVDVSFTTAVYLDERRNKLIVENPVGDQINGYFEVETSGDYYFELHSINGSLWNKLLLGSLSSGRNHFSINTGYLESGCYIYRISGHDGQFEGLLVK